MDASLKIDQQVSDCIKQCIVDILKPKIIMIFGSYATDSATVDSDIDIMAVVDDEQSSDRVATVKARIAIRKALQAIDKDMAFDLVLSKQSVFSKAKLIKGTIQYAANQQGVAIYGRH